MSGVRACDVCYQKKIRCHIVKVSEPCNWCGHHGLLCTFIRRTEKRKRKRAKWSDVQELQSRIRQLEGANSQGSRDDRLTNQDMPNSDDPVTLNTPHDEAARSRAATCSDDSPISSQLPDTIVNDIVSESQLGLNWYCKGITLFSDTGQAWVSSRTGETVTWNEFGLLGSRSHVLSSALRSGSSYEELLQLPGKDKVQKALDAFFSSYFHFCYPVLERELFEQTIETAYESIDTTTSSLVHVSARACVLAALSLMCRLEELRNALIGVDGDICAAKAQLLLGYVSGDTSLVHLQTVLLLQRHRTYTGQMRDVTLLHARACRIVTGLGGHIYHSSIDDGLRKKSHELLRPCLVRKLFWLCYMLDKDMSLRSGQPPALTEDYCDLTPLRYAKTDCLVSHHTDEEPVKSGSILQAQLSCLKAKVYHLLFSPRALKAADGQLLLNIRQLDSELERWRLSIPFDHRPQLSISQDHAFEASYPTSMHGTQYLNFQLEYHYLLTVVHTTVRRCRGDTDLESPMPEDLHTVIHSSTDLSLEASRSTIFLLASLRVVLPTESYNEMIFYAIVAAMSLFTNILLHPLSPLAHHDQVMLTTVAEIVRSMPLGAMTRDDIRHMQDLSEFATILAHLGHCAISKLKGRQVATDIAEETFGSGLTT